MLVICNGMPRSASTWSFNVVLGLLRALRPLQKVHSGYDESVAHFLESAPPDATHAVVKCHQLDARGRALTQAGTARTVYTWRDPADAIVSCMGMFDHDFETALHAVKSSLQLYDFHRRGGVALILDYERIVTTPVGAVQRIAAFLGLEDHGDTVRVVAAENGLQRMREKAESLPDKAQLIRLCGFPHDPETLLHPGHIRDGSSGYGRKALTAQQLQRIDGLLAHRRALPR